MRHEIGTGNSGVRSLQKLRWQFYCLDPGLRDNEVGPGGPRSRFLLLLLLGISPGWLPDSLVKVTPYLIINPFILKLATE